MNIPIKIKTHPLKDEIINKLNSGNLVLSTGQINSNFVWTQEKEKELKEALKIVKEKM